MLGFQKKKKKKERKKNMFVMLLIQAAPDKHIIDYVIFCILHYQTLMLWL